MCFFGHSSVFHGYEMIIGLGVLVCSFLKYYNCVKSFFWNEALMVFSAIMSKSQCYWSSWVLAAIRALYYPCQFSWRVFVWSWVDDYPHAFVSLYPVFGFVGFNGWKHFVSLRLVHLGIGLFPPLKVVKWVILFFLCPIFTSTLWLFDWGATRAIPCVC